MTEQTQGNLWRERPALIYGPLVLFLVGCAAIYIGERALGDLARYIMDGFGLLCVAALVLAYVRMRQCTGDRRLAARRILLEYGIAFMGLALYFLQSSDLDLIPAGKIQTVLQVVWPAVLMIGLVPSVTMELALAGMARTPEIELWRLRFAARAARIVVLALIAFAGINYAAAKWNRKVDLTYFKTTEPGSSTLKIIEGLTKDVTFYLFFPPGNEVLEQSRSYVETLAAASDHATVEVVDQALDPDLARKLRVRANGNLAIHTGNNTETLRLGLDIENARSKLRKLDSDLQQKLLRLVRPKRTAYITSGHMERDYAPSSDDKRLGLRDFRTLLDSLGLQVKRLGLGEGLGSEIPEDATVVIITGPTEPFLPAERAALKAYIDRGGRLFIMIDPDTGPTEDQLLGLLGVKVSKKLVANPRYLFRVEGRGESPYNLVTTRSSAHPTVTTISRSAGKLGVLFLGAGSISKTERPPAEMKITFTVRSMAQSWLDENGNGRLDKPDEKQTALDFAAAIERASSETNPTPMRAVVVADADVAGDGLVRNPGNAYFLRDSIRWLVGDEDTAGTVESEQDIPLVHRKDDDTIWFYGTSFLIPAGVLAGGLAISSASRRKKKGKK